MKCGAVMGLCVAHSYGADALASMRRHSAPETECVAVFNGLEPWPVPDGVEVIRLPDRLAGPGVNHDGPLWALAFELARERGWDWCLSIHDDCLLDEPGWEDHLARGAERYRIGVAGWFTSDWVDRGAQSELRVGGPLRILADGCAIAFNMALFGPRGCFADVPAASGYGDWEAALWALGQGFCAYHLPFAARHRPGELPHTRTLLRVGAGAPLDSSAGGKYLRLLPARVVDDGDVELGEERRRMSVQR